MGGEGMETGSASPDPFRPTAGEWEAVTIDLGAFDGVDNLTIALVNKSGWGNRLYLDNIELSSSGGRLQRLRSGSRQQQHHLF